MRREEEYQELVRLRAEVERLRAELADVKEVLREAELVMERKEARIEAALALQQQMLDMPWTDEREMLGLVRELAHATVKALKGRKP